MKTIRSILEELCDDVAEDIILGNSNKKRHINHTMSEIKKLMNKCRPKYDDEHPKDCITGEPVETYGYEVTRNTAIYEYESNLHKALGKE